MVSTLGGLARGPETGLGEISYDLPEADFWSPLVAGTHGDRLQPGLFLRSL